MRGRIYQTIDEAIQAAAFRSGKQVKALAGEMDMGRSEFSLKASGQGRFFNPVELVLLQRRAHEYSVLYTMADLLGFERPAPKSQDLQRVLLPLFDQLEPMQEALDILRAVRKQQGGGE